MGRASRMRLSQIERPKVGELASTADWSRLLELAEEHGVLGHLARISDLDEEIVPAEKKFLARRTLPPAALPNAWNEPRAVSPLGTLRRQGHWGAGRQRPGAGHRRLRGSGHPQLRGSRLARPPP